MSKMKKAMSLYRLEDKQLKDTKGAYKGCCTCRCSYANCGGSSTVDNLEANDSLCLSSTPEGCR